LELAAAESADVPANAGPQRLAVASRTDAFSANVRMIGFSLKVERKPLSGGVSRCSLSSTERKRKFFC
jgi:hypothetical protein